MCGCWCCCKDGQGHAAVWAASRGSRRIAAAAAVAAPWRAGQLLRPGASPSSKALLASDGGRLRWPPARPECACARTALICFSAMQSNRRHQSECDRAVLWGGNVGQAGAALGRRRCARPLTADFCDPHVCLPPSLNCVAVLQHANVNSFAHSPVHPIVRWLTWHGAHPPRPCTRRRASRRRTTAG